MKKIYKWFLKLVVNWIDKNSDEILTLDEIMDKIRDIVKEIIKP